MSTGGGQRGFTMVEILVGMTIGLFLMAGMIEIYVANKQTFRFSDALSRIQENGRFAVAHIAADMRMADFWGCSRGNNLTDNLVAGTCTTPTATSTNALTGTDGAVGVPDLPDTITLRGAVGGSGLIVDPTTTTTALNVQATVTDTQEMIDVDDIALVSDCQNADLFQVTSLGGGSPTLVGNATGGPGAPGNATNMLSKVYDQTAAVHRWREVLYSLAAGANGQSALFMTDDACTGGVARELVENVVNMQIAYGEDVDGDGTADRYVNASTVVAWDSVVSVRINLLLTSEEDNLVDQPQQITLDNYDGDNTNDVFTAPDRRLHQVITATFAIRNRPRNLPL